MMGHPFRVLTIVIDRCCPGVLPTVVPSVTERGRLHRPVAPKSDAERVERCHYFLTLATERPQYGHSIPRLTTERPQYGHCIPLLATERLQRNLCVPLYVDCRPQRGHRSVTGGTSVASTLGWYTRVGAPTLKGSPTGELLNCNGLFRIFHRSAISNKKSHRVGCSAGSWWELSKVFQRPALVRCSTGSVAESSGRKGTTISRNHQIFRQKTSDGAQKKARPGTLVYGKRGRGLIA